MFNDWDLLFFVLVYKRYLLLIVIRMTKKLVLAIDIERSGATFEYDTIAVGACVMNESFEELDRYFCNCYFPEITKFEKFYPAEDEHQDYFNLNPSNMYC